MFSFKFKPPTILRPEYIQSADQPVLTVAKLEDEHDEEDEEFDWVFYLDKYTDLIENGVTTKEDAIKHWNDLGQLEGRMGKEHNFDWLYYLAVNPDLRPNGIITHKLAYNHWQSFGQIEGRICYNPDFAWKTYLDYNPDLIKNGINSKKLAIEHWLNCGQNEQRIYRNINSHPEYELFNKYPNLFHKYLLHLNNPDTHFQYEVIHAPIIIDMKFVNKYICAIHCYNLNLFNEMFDEYIGEISKYFNIIITFHIDNENIRKTCTNYTFIKMPNIGMDVGSKFIVTDYLNKMNYEYTYLFFIHSKSNRKRRNEYIAPLVSNLANIFNLIEFAVDTVGGFFPDAIHCGANINLSHFFIHQTYYKNQTITWSRNKIYMNDICQYMDLNQNFFFPEGNCYILHRDVVNKLFTDTKLYNILNWQNSFDYNWVKTYYKLNINDYNNVYQEYKNHNWSGNNIQTKLGHNGLADSMIEHIFERIVFTVIFKEQMKIKIYSINNAQIGKLNTILNHNPDLLSKEDNIQLINELHNSLFDKNGGLPNICIIACHTYNFDKCNIIINNIQHFKKYTNKIVLVNSLEFKNNDLMRMIHQTYPTICINDKMTRSQLMDYKTMNSDLHNLSINELQKHYDDIGQYENRPIPFDCNVYMYYVENDKFACFSKYMYYLENFNISQYNKIILTNDSYLIVNSLDTFFEYSNMGVDMTGLIASNQTKYHYPDFLRCYNKYSIRTLMQFYKTNRSKIDDNFINLINTYEIESTYLFDNRNVVYEVNAWTEGYDPNNVLEYNIHFIDRQLEYYLTELQYPIIKYKKLLSTIYTVDDKKLPDKKLPDKKLPEDFDIAIYKKINADLAHLSDTFAPVHFLNTGMAEGRLYKYDQVTVLPEYLYNFLKEHSLLGVLYFLNTL